MKKGEKLYNMIFPVWLLWLIPITWIVVLPANFLLDLAVILSTMKYLKITEIKQKSKSVIFKTWILGFIADFIGTFFMLSVSLIDSKLSLDTAFGKWWYYNMNAVTYSPLDNIYSILWTAICVVITALFIYLLNYKICFKKLEIEDALKKKLALSLAIFTAPYLFFLPTSLFF
ncbi:MAG: hypothetical protein AB7D36_05800 [Oscillospiraceae bacterium]